ncbi:MAG: GNAT family N-acetyltransferase [Gemmatimonadota bacterium]|nr:GNAT family N-acetyltransferase [Gemmatimonadota bacterium]
MAIRCMGEADIQVMQTGFAAMGWSKPSGYFRECARAAKEGRIEVWMAEVEGAYAGHVKIAWDVGDPPAPEIQDLAVLPSFRRRGIASQLLETAEAAAFRRAHLVRIGVGLHPGYGAAQRLYVGRGFIPDGRGATYEGRVMQEGALVKLDDELVLHLEKRRTDRPVGA